MLSADAHRAARLIVAVIVGALLGGCSQPLPPRPTATTGPSMPSASAAASATLTSPIGQIVRRTPLSQELLGIQSLIAGGSSVWIASSATPRGWVERLDAASGAEIARIAVGWAPSALAFDGSRLWVADSIGDGSQHEAVQNQVEVLDTTSNKVLRTYPVPVPTQLVPFAGAIWVVSPDGGNESHVRRLDPSTGQLRSFTIPAPGARQLVVAGGRLWTATWNDAGGTELWGIDPATGDPPKQLRLDGEVSTITADDAGLYVVGSPQITTISRVDPGSGKLLASSDPIDGVQTVAAAGGELWVVAGDGALHRLSGADLREEGQAVSLGGPASAMDVGKTVFVATDRELVEVQP